jgi:hypothetical protein
MSMSFSRGFDVGTILRSRDILDAAPGRWGFENIASYDWAVTMPGAAPMMLTYETIAIDNLTNPPRCAADYNQDGGVDGADVEAFFIDWQDGLFDADVNQDGGVDGADVEAFFLDWQDSIPCADANRDGGVDGGDVETFFLTWQTGGC